MTHYEDLAPCTYLPFRDEHLLAVGWLEAGHAYAKGPLPADDVIEALAQMIANPWEPAHAMGWHDCSMCRLSIGPRRLAVGTSGMAPVNVDMGITNVFVPGEGVVYVAPSLVLHYVDSHEYALPESFVAAVRTCPPMGTAKYLYAIRRAVPSLLPPIGRQDGQER